MENKPHNDPFPLNENIVFHASSFFTQPHAPPSLPTPTEVRKAASLSTNPRAKLATRPPPVSFPKLGLLVKYGTEVAVTEGQCLVFIRNTLPEVVPVPEVFGWCEDDGQAFIYMQLVDGVTLEESWGAMNEGERTSVCRQLRSMIDAWRGVKQDSWPPFIGRIGKQSLLDIIFTASHSPPAGPFDSVSLFHDWFTTAYGPGRHVQATSPHPYRSFLPDNIPIVFTHADLHPSNIMLSSRPDPQIVAMVDWHQSGWYPEYWEYCKARWTSRIGEEWESEYLPLVLDRWGCYDYWDYFVLARGV